MLDRLLRRRDRGARRRRAGDGVTELDAGRSMLSRIACAPISWGVCEVPGWGVQLSQGRVLDELLAVGLRATELGPEGFLPAAPRATRSLLDARGIACVGGFVPATLHDPQRADAELLDVLGAARRLAGLGAEVLVLAATWPGEGYDGHRRLEDHEWDVLVESLGRAQATAAQHGLALAVHPHVGTAIEKDEDVQRLLAETDAALCLDTGHLSIGGVDVLDVARRFPDRIAHVHLKDVDAGLASRVREADMEYGEAVAEGLYRPLGSGDVQVGAVVRALEAGGYSGWYVLEQDVMLTEVPAPATGPVVDVLASANFLRGVAEGLT